MAHTQSIQTARGKVTISPGCISGITFASITDAYGQESPLFAWMPADGSAVDDADFLRELMDRINAGDSAPEGSVFWQQVHELWNRCKQAQHEFFMAIDGF